MNRTSFYSRSTTAFDYLQARAPRELWASVLKQAIADATEPGLADFESRGLSPSEIVQLSLTLRVAAEEWIADEENEPRRFVWVCEQLGMDPGAVRRRIAEKCAAA